MSERVPIQIRLDPEMIKRLDKLADDMARATEFDELRKLYGLKEPTRSDALRAALIAGLEALEKHKQ
jgi:predicted transcriptional regulator